MAGRNANVFEDMKELVAAYKARDPAARSTLEILLLYPGVRPCAATAAPTGATSTG